MTAQGSAQGAASSQTGQSTASTGGCADFFYSVASVSAFAAKMQAEVRCGFPRLGYVPGGVKGFPGAIVSCPHVQASWLSAVGNMFWCGVDLPASDAGQGGEAEVTITQPHAESFRYAIGSYWACQSLDSAQKQAWVRQFGTCGQ